MDADFNIRLATSQDAPGILSIYGPICENSPITFETRRPTVEEMEGRIDKIVSSHPWLVVERAGHCLGYAYAGPHHDRAAYRWAINVSVYIHPDARRTGVGTGLYFVLFELLRAQGFYRAYAGITLPNPGSVRLHQQMGFAPVGTYHAVGYKSGKWHDVQWLEAILRSGTGEPEEPLAISAISSDAWEAAIDKGRRLMVGRH